MRDLSKTELFAQSNYGKIITSVLKEQLIRDIGRIAPNQLESDLILLKASARSKTNSLLSGAINLYESYGGRIRLFDLDLDNIGAVKSSVSLPRVIPFIVGPGRPDTMTGQSSVAVPLGNSQLYIYTNMYGTGAWNGDNTIYHVNSPNTDLLASLEASYVIFSLRNGKQDKVLNNHNVVEILTRIYTDLFLKTANNVTQRAIHQEGDLKKDEAKFHIAKFFLVYCVGRVNDASTDGVAYASIKSKTPLNTITEMAQYKTIDYESLSGFLKTFGKEFFNSEIMIQEFAYTWQKMYGENMYFALEYIPYLLFFLICTARNARCAGSSRLLNRSNDLNQLGLQKLILAITSEI